MSFLSPRLYSEHVPAFLQQNPGISLQAAEAWGRLYKGLPEDERRRFDETRRHNLVVGPQNRMLAAAGYAALRVAQPETPPWEALPELSQYRYLQLAMAINEHVFREGVDMTLLRVGRDDDFSAPPVFLFAVAGAALA